MILKQKSVPQKTFFSCSKLNLQNIIPSGPCLTTSGKRCKFPLKYNGKTYTEKDGCVKGKSYLWCAIRLNPMNGLQEWDHCDKDKCQGLSITLTRIICICLKEFFFSVEMKGKQHSNTLILQL